MQKKTYITPTLRIREVQLTLLETMSGRDQDMEDIGEAKSSRKRNSYDDFSDEYEYDDFYFE